MYQISISQTPHCEGGTGVKETHNRYFVEGSFLFCEILNAECQKPIIDKRYHSERPG